MPFRPKDRHKDRARAGDKPGATHEQVERRERFQRAQRESLQPSDDTTVLYGWHPVTAALQNPARRVRKLLATENAARRLADEKIPTAQPPRGVAQRRRDRMPAKQHGDVLGRLQAFAAGALEPLAAIHLLVRCAGLHPRSGAVL